MLAPDGRPLEGYWVHARNLETGFRKTVGFNQTDGSWRMPGLPTGPYEIEIQSEQGNGKAKAELGVGADGEVPEIAVK